VSDPISRRWPLPATLLAGLILPLALPAGASAADLRCRASALRVTSAGPDHVASEPIRANESGAPCTRQEAGLTDTVMAGGATVATPRAATDIGEAGPAAAASVATLGVSLPGLSVQARGLDAAVAVRCTAGSPSPASSSRVAELVVNGRAITLPDPSAPRTLDLGPLGSVSVNQVRDDGVTVVRRALVVDTPAADAVGAEAIAAADADACAALAAGAGGLGAGDGSESDRAGRLCPRGAELDATTRHCVIRAGARTGDGRSDITVGRPFEGPSGGTVVALDRARRTARSACLRGRGPAYAIFGGTGADRVTGTNQRDRILGRGGKDHLEGGRGDDCMDGGKARDVLTGALGGDSVYGGPGNDAVNGGSGTDVLVGGSGNDSMNTGYGADRVLGGRGRDSINAATAGPAVRKLDCGRGRDTARVNRNELRRVRRCERLYSIR
jgi:Ca2+-binding RTX toxin-like protein